MRKPLRLPLFCLLATAAACSQPAEQNNVAENVENAENVATLPADAGNAAANTAAATPAQANETTPAAAAARYGASGSEPFWSLTIENGKMDYKSANGPNVTEAVQTQENLPNGYRYRGERLTVVTNHEKCQDTNDEIVFADTIQVTVDGETVSGCGGKSERI